MPGLRPPSLGPGVLRHPAGLTRGFCNSLTYGLRPLVSLRVTPCRWVSDRPRLARAHLGVSMPTFVLIHGGLCRGWVWDETAAALREDGHRVEVVDLPSSGTVVAIRRGDDTAAREYSPPASPVCLFGGGW